MQYLTKESPFNQKEFLGSEKGSEAEKKMSREKYDRKMERSFRLDEKSFKKDEEKFNSGAKLRRRAGRIRGKLNINNVKD